MPKPRRTSASSVSGLLAAPQLHGAGHPGAGAGAGQHADPIARHFWRGASADQHQRKQRRRSERSSGRARSREQSRDCVWVSSHGIAGVHPAARSGGMCSAQRRKVIPHRWRRLAIPGDPGMSGHTACRHVSSSRGQKSKPFPDCTRGPANPSRADRAAPACFKTASVFRSRHSPRRHRRPCPWGRSSAGGKCQTM
jgi:hypothetical protein